MSVVWGDSTSPDAVWCGAILRLWPTYITGLAVGDSDL